MKKLIKNIFKIITLLSLFVGSASSNTVGLQNLGNRCYFNALTQCLLKLEPLNTLLRDNIELYQDNSLARAFVNLQDAYNSETGPAYRPTDFYNAIFASSRTYTAYDLAKGEQRDSADLFRFITKYLCGTDEMKDQPTGIFTELNRFTSTKNYVSNLLENNATYRYLKDINKRLNVGLKETRRCPNNHEITNHTLTQISLPINADNLNELLNNYCNQGTAEYFCEQCNDYVTGEERRKFFHLPQILSIQLKRFSKSNGTISKITSGVSIPLDLDVSDYITSDISDDVSKIYNLIGVVCHSGSLDGGHYFAYVKDGDTWYKCNDSSATIVTNLTSTMGTTTPYILFYQRNDVPVATEEENMSVDTSTGEMELTASESEAESLEHERREEEAAAAKAKADEQKRLAEIARQQKIEEQREQEKQEEEKRKAAKQTTSYVVPRSEKNNVETYLNQTRTYAKASNNKQAKRRFNKIVGIITEHNDLAIAITIPGKITTQDVDKLEQMIEYNR